MMALSSPQVSGSLLGPNASLTYQVDLQNWETHAVDGLQLELQATPRADLHRSGRRDSQWS